MPFIVPLVPTGIYTGVRTSPCGNVTVKARANPDSASMSVFNGFYYCFSFFLDDPK